MEKYSQIYLTLQNVFESNSGSTIASKDATKIPKPQNSFSKAHF